MADIANAGIWDRFSNWMQTPQAWQAMGAVGEALGQVGNGGEGTSFAKALNQGYVQPTAKGQIAKQYGDAKKQEQMKWSELLSQPHVGEVSETTKPDGSISTSIKATPQSDLAKAEIIRAQQQAGQVQPIAPAQAGQGQGQPSAAVQAPPQNTYGFQGAEEVQAGTNAARGRFSDALANPTTSPSSASGLGLSPEELLATEAGAREYVAQPITNAYNARLSDQLALSTEMKRKQGLVPISIPGEPGAQPKVLWVTPKEMLDYEESLRKDAREREYHQLLMGQRADQQAAMLPVREAQTQANQALADERRAKIDREKAIEEMLQARGNEKVPGTDYTYREAHRLGVLDDLLKQSQANTLQANKERQDRKRQMSIAQREIAKSYDEVGSTKGYITGPNGKPRKMTPKERTEAIQTELQMYFPDVYGEVYGAPQQNQSINVLPPGARLVPGKVGPSGGKVYEFPDPQNPGKMKRVEER